MVKLGAGADVGVAEGDRVGVDEILLRMAPFLVYGYCDMTGEGKVGLWGGYGEYMEIFPGTAAKDPRPAPGGAAHPLRAAGERGSTGSTSPACRRARRSSSRGRAPGARGARGSNGQRAGQVIVTGTAADGLRLDAATAMGATHTVKVDAEDVGELVRDLTEWSGCGRRVRHRLGGPDGPGAIDLVRSRRARLLAGPPSTSRGPGLRQRHHRDEGP